MNSLSALVTFSSSTVHLPSSCCMHLLHKKSPPLHHNVGTNLGSNVCRFPRNHVERFTKSFPISVLTISTTFKVPVNSPRMVCVDVPISNPRQECRQVPRTECDVLEGSVTEEYCTVVSSTSQPMQNCKYLVWLSLARNKNYRLQVF